MKQQSLMRCAASLLLGVLLLSFGGCTSSQQNKEEDVADSAKTSRRDTMKFRDTAQTFEDREARRKAGASRTAPNECRIIGTVVSIDPVLSAESPTSPCSKVPCQAIVRVDSVLIVGNRVINPLTVGSDVRIGFVYTLSPSTEYFPRLPQPLPGLKVGSRFQADVRERRLPPDKARRSTFQDVPYQVMEYQVM